MADETLISAIERHEALADEAGDVSKERTKALDYYLGEPMGNEVDGRSQVISRDVFDTVEWIKPQISDIFCGGDEVVNFTPQGPEDVQAAEQETQFVNYVVNQKNNWFKVFYDWAHDALLQKTGYVKCHWDEAEDRNKEKYKGLTDEELIILLEHSKPGYDISVLAHEQTQEGHDITIEKLKRYGCVKLMNVAPERVFVDVNARGIDLQDPRLAFIEQREHKTITQLRDEGFDVEDDLSDSGDGASEWEETSRQINSPMQFGEGQESDTSMRRVLVREVWIRFDDNDDGLAELLHVIIVGTTILLKEECDMVPLVALCPTPLPHQHHGLGLADAVMDLQDIKTALLRGSLDNVYLANNGRHAVDSEVVNLDDLLVSRPGGIVRGKGNPNTWIAPLNHTSTGDVGMKAMEYIDRIKTQRTGVNEQSQGLDSNTINKNTPYATTSALMSAAQQRIRFIARVFAETGVKALFQVVHSITLHHSRKAELIQLRNQWVSIDPRQWTKRTDMQIAVGLGAGDKPQQMMFLEKVLQIQTIAVPQGLSDKTKVYNTLKRLSQVAGFKDPNEFWTDPSTQPPQPPAPDPELMKEQAKAQAQIQIEQAKASSTHQIEQMKAGLKMQELRANLELQASNDQRDAEREVARAQFDAETKRQQLALDEWKAQLQAEMEKYKADLQAATQIQLAGMNNEAQVNNTLIAGEQQERNQDKQLEAKASEQKAGAEKEDSAKKAMAEVQKQMRELAKQQKELDDRARKPTKVIREDGKIVAVDIGGVRKNVVRGADGRVNSIQ
jgi:hypothetical protein